MLSSEYSLEIFNAISLPISNNNKMSIKSKKIFRNLMFEWKNETTKQNTIAFFSNSQKYEYIPYIFHSYVEATPYLY